MPPPMLVRVNSTLVVFEDDEFLLGRRGRRFDGEFGGGFPDRILDGRGEFLQGFLALFRRGLRALVLTLVVEIDGEQGAAKGEDDPGFSIVHGGGVKVLGAG